MGGWRRRSVDDVSLTGGLAFVLNSMRTICQSPIWRGSIKPKSNNKSSWWKSSSHSGSLVSCSFDLVGICKTGNLVQVKISCSNDSLNMKSYKLYDMKAELGQLCPLNLPSFEFLLCYLHITDLKTWLGCDASFSHCYLSHCYQWMLTMFVNTCRVFRTCKMIFSLATVIELTSWIRPYGHKPGWSVT